MPKAWLWAYVQSFSLKFSQVRFLEYSNFERIFWRARETLVTNFKISGFQIRIFRWRSNGSLWLHMLGVRQKFGGLISFNNVLALHFHGETQIPKCTSSGNPLTYMGCTDPQLPFIWKPEIYIWNFTQYSNYTLKIKFHKKFKISELLHWRTH